MRGRSGGRVGVPFAPSVGAANGVFHVSEVLWAKKFSSWPIVGTSAASAPAVRLSSHSHAKITSIKSNGGSVA